MENKLKHIYGRRVTPSVRIMFLVVTILFALDLACANDELSRQQQAQQRETEASFSPGFERAWNI